MSLAVVGPDGAGKTTYIREVLKLQGKNPVEWTKRLPMKRDTAWRLTHEVLMGLEKAYNYVKWHISGTNGFVLDRCFIDAEVYASLWSWEEGTFWPLRITNFINRIAYKPDTVIQLRVGKHFAKPKRPYTPTEIGIMNHLFTTFLEDHGYSEVSVSEYDLGKVIVWRRDTNSSSTAERVSQLSSSSRP